jgi:hypothetical protein
MRQYLLATTPGGRTFRWGEDEPNAENIFADLEDSDSAPGGCKELSCSLARKPSVDYSDMQRGTRIELFGAGQRKCWEGELVDAPHSSGDHLVMTPAAVGYQGELSDREEAQEIFVDADLSSWGESSTQRQLNSANSNFPLVAATSTGFQDAGELPPGLIIDYRNVDSVEGKTECGELCYFGGGVDIGSVMAGFKNIGAIVEGNASWTDLLRVSVDDVLSSYQDGTNLHATTTAQTSVTAPGPGYKYAFAVAANSSAGVFTYVDCHLWTTPKVIGRHGLPLYGTWPEIGVLASDVAAYALSKWAPGISYTTGPYGSIKPSQFVIPHLAFKEPTTVKELIEQALRFELLEWGVWPGANGPAFSLNPKGQREGSKRWRVRLGPAQFKDTSQSLEQQYNRVVVSYTGFDGTLHVIGPLGSGLRVTSERLINNDPQLPLNEAGKVRTKHIALNKPATQPGAEEAAEAFLEQVALLDGAGEATLTGFVEDEHGAEWPYYCVEAGHEIELLGSSLPGYRYIVDVGRSRANRAATIHIDAPPDGYAALLERLDVREEAAALG